MKCQIVYESKTNTNFRKIKANGSVNMSFKGTLLYRKYCSRLVTGRGVQSCVTDSLSDAGKVTMLS